jgi:hypothetical protein
MFLEKSGAILVLPETPAPPPEDAAPAAAREPVSAIQPIRAPAIEPVAAPAIAPVAAPVIQSVAALTIEPIRAPAIERSPAPHVVVMRPRRSARRAALPRAPYTVWQFLRCRLMLLALLALIVASQPWWWNIGSLRVRPHRAPEAPASSP